MLAALWTATVRAIAVLTAVLAIGVFIGITPTIPLHTILAVSLALLVRGSKLAAALGVWAVVFGMTIGVFSAVFRNRWPDRGGMTLAVSGISFPSFALGMLFMQVFSVKLGWLPTVGADSWKHYILPSITLGAAVAGVGAMIRRRR